MALLDDAAFAVVVLDNLGTPIAWNAHAKDLLALDEADAKATMEYLQREHAQGLGDAVARMLRGEAVDAREMRRERSDGSEATMLVSGGPLRAADGMCVGALVSLVDISARKGMEDNLEVRGQQLEDIVEERTRELEEANERLRAATVAKQAFMASMGHEMRTHLNSVIGFSGLLLEGLAGPLSEEQGRQLGMVQQAGKSLLALVNDVVDLAKMEAGLLPLNLERFELLSFVEGVVSSFEEAATRKGLMLEVDTPAGALPVRTDAKKLEQALQNLLSNALKYTSRGRIVVTVRRDSDGKSVIIQVSDSGEGISPEVMSRIFDEFVKYERGSREREGTGLGLAITRRLCEMLGGSVSARSNPGEGSVFTLVLPMDIGQDGE